MKRVTAPILTLAFALTMSAASATALSSNVKYEKFADPTESAFSYEVPANWQTKGGILRKSATDAKPWMTVISPDNEIKIFFGDPEAVRPSLGWTQSLPASVLRKTGATMLAAIMS
jgi:hypothetical protein